MLNLSSTVHIQYFKYLTYILFIFLGCTMNSHNDLLPAGLTAQLVESCTSDGRFLGLNAVHT